MNFNKTLGVAALAAATIVSFVAQTSQANAATEAQTIEITGEVIDTWCYFSGVMGGPEAVVGSAHHTCAVWCAAGGIPVGVLTDDGTVYMVMKLQGAAPLEDSEALLEIQSDRIVASGKHYLRDGINYLIVENVVDNTGITNLTHKDYGVIPPFAIPKNLRGE